MTIIDEAVLVASTIPGWCEPAELEWLADQASRHVCIIEVGVWQGRSCKAMASTTAGVVYAVDDWRGAEGDGEHGPGGFPLGVDATPHDELEARFRANLADELASGRVVSVAEPSPGAALHFILGQADMVYIDGDHDTEPVRADIRAWLDVLKPDGLLCGHDGGDPRVAEALRLEGIDHRIAASGIWFRV